MPSRPVTQATSPNALLEAALFHAARKQLVIPLHSIRGGRCSCGKDTCRSPGKHPRTANGSLDGSIDQDQIRSSWEHSPDANVGVVTGAQSGVVVLDVDPRHGGDDSLEGLIREHGPLPPGPSSQTGGGGRHFFFRHPGGKVANRVGIAPGLDVRGDNGFVIVPPSLHVSGSRYVWATSPAAGGGKLPEMPPWLLKACRGGDVRLNRAPGVGSSDPIPEGLRDNTLTSIAGTLRQFGADEETILYHLRHENTRCAPALPDTDLARIAASIGRRPTSGDAIIARHGARVSIESRRDGSGAPLVTVWGKTTGPIAAQRCRVDVLKDRDALLEQVSPEVRDEARELCKQLSMIPGPRPVPRRATNHQGHGIDFDQLEPWPDPVSGAELLDELCRVIRRFVVLPENSEAAIALWIVLSYAHREVAVLPLLAFISPEKQCGKTTALAVVGALADRPLPASNVTPAALFRTVEMYTPTLLIDEADTFLRDNDELRGLLNSGHSRSGAFVLRTVGDDHEPRKFSTWAPKCIAQIGALAATLQDRAIVINLKRRSQSEHVERFRLDGAGELRPLKRRIARWVQDFGARISKAEPSMPDELSDRAADNWRGPVGIADLVGGRWPALARNVAIAVTGNAKETDVTVGIQLLADLREIFSQRGESQLSSANIVVALGAREDRPWPEFSHGKPLSARQLARLLKPFGVEPRKIRTGEATAQGYLRSDLEDAFARYLAPGPEHPEQRANDAVSSRLKDPEHLAGVPDGGMTAYPRQSSVVPDVPDATGLGREQCDPKAPGEIPDLTRWDDQFRPWLSGNGDGGAVAGESEAHPETLPRPFGTPGGAIDEPHAPPEAP